MNDLKILIREEKLFRHLTDSQLENRFTFSDIEKKFSERIKKIEKGEIINIKEYFGEGIGVKKSKKKIIEDNILESNVFEEKLNKRGKVKYEDFKGLYIFYSKGKPFYVGISRGVINRIQQHVKTGKSHYSASMAYKIACIQHQLNGLNTVWKRDDLSYEDNIKPVQEILMKKQVLLMPIKNDEDLYLFEVYCSIHFNTILNKFTTH